MKPAIIRPDLELKSEIKSIPARNVIYIRLSGDYKLNDYGGTWGRLWQFIKEQKLPMGDFSPLCIYHDDPKVTPAEKLRTDVLYGDARTGSSQRRCRIQDTSGRTLCNLLI